MATVRERRKLNQHWFRKLLRGEPHFVIGNPANPYLLRWFLVPRNPFFNVYVHKFLRSDDDRALHDHPWWFLSVILSGGYWEHRHARPISACSWRPAGSIALRRPNTLHRVELDHTAARTEKPCWSLIFTGPKVREWGFLCSKGWLHWEKFDSQNGCGEYA